MQYIEKYNVNACVLDGVCDVLDGVGKVDTRPQHASVRPHNTKVFNHDVGRQQTSKQPSPNCNMTHAKRVTNSVTQEKLLVHTLSNNTYNVSVKVIRKKQIVLRL